MDLLAPPPSTSRRAEVVVIGGGAIGLTTAWNLAQTGRSVLVVDPTPARGAMWTAAGMLAPVSESHFGEEALGAFLVAAAAEWARFAPELEGATGTSIGYRRTGTLLVARDAGDKAELDRVAGLQRQFGLESVPLDRDALHALESALAPSVRAGLHVPGDHQVDTRALARTLLTGLVAAGVGFYPARALELKGTSVLLDEGTVIEAGAVVLCPGARLGAIAGLEEERLPTIRPIGGLALRLAGAPLLTRTVRAMVEARSVYLVPRVGGELVVGATADERGFSTEVRAGDVHRLLDDARRVVPGVDELELVDATCALRPGSPDNAPTIESRHDGRLVVSVGHYRNGILLAPLSAALVVALLEGADHPAQALLEAAHER